VVHFEQQPVFADRNPLLSLKMKSITLNLLKIAAPDPHDRPVFAGFLDFLRTKKNIFLWILLAGRSHPQPGARE
jgi:hypothetical protein